MKSHAALAPLLVVLTVAAASGCSSASGKGAARGATMGAVGGAVGGALSSLLFGGNVLESAGRGAVVGAGTGAATGAVAGAMSDADAKKAQEAARQPKQPALTPEAEAIRKQYGPKAWDAIVLLGECRHEPALAVARDAAASAPDRTAKAYALFVEAVTLQEAGRSAEAGPIQEEISGLLGGGKTPDSIRASVLEGVLTLQRLRRDHGLPPVCPGK